MELDVNSNAFDLLAFLCSFFSKEKERECSEMTSVATLKDVREIIEKYKNIIAMVLNASADEYSFNSEEIEYINGYLKEMNDAFEKNEIKFEEIYFLVIELEHCIDRFSDWQGRGAIFQIEPLNSNYKETGISIYPHYLPAWNTDKSERRRDRTFNAKFENHIMIRNGDAAPFEILMHYWNDSGLLQAIEDGWQLRVALSPVMDNARINDREVDGKYGKGKQINGVENENEVTERVIRIFDALFENQYGIIVFPEVLGSDEIVNNIKARMQQQPEIYTFVLLPTICRDDKNVLVVLGPGGIELLRRDKGTAFIEQDEDGECYREQLKYNNKMELLITKELGNIAFPICAELLEPQYYAKMLEEGHADFIIIPSFSPGYRAFEKTLRKGEAAMTLGLWINCCSAKEISRNGKVPEVLAAIQLPDASDNNCVHQIEPKCSFTCSDEICYFDITIIYQKERFYIKCNHCMRA